MLDDKTVVEYKN